MLFKMRLFSWRMGYETEAPVEIIRSPLFRLPLVQVHFDKKKYFLLLWALSDAYTIEFESRVRERGSSYRYGLELAGNIPDESSGMKGNIGVIAYLVKY
jgi:hypothetical protein